ncbi:MAG: hypothetical protein ACC631_02175, partial [Halocynthiibacter sp.]
SRTGPSLRNGENRPVTDRVADEAAVRGNFTVSFDLVRPPVRMGGKRKLGNLRETGIEVK